MVHTAVKVSILGVVLSLVPAWLVAQDPASGDPSTNHSPVQSAHIARNQQGGAPQESTGGTSTDPQGMKDKQFVRKAGEGGYAEIQLAKLALQKSGNEGVKAFAQKMIDDHTMLNENMKPIAESLGVMTPKHLNKEDQGEYDKLNGLSGADFDKEYIAFMVKDHRKDLHEFRQESASAEDPALKEATTKGAKVIREHLSMIEKLASQNGVEVPGRARPAPTS